MNTRKVVDVLRARASSLKQEAQRLEALADEIVAAQSKPAMPPSGRLLTAIYERAGRGVIPFGDFYVLARDCGYPDRRGLGGFFSRDGRSLEQAGIDGVRLSDAGVRGAERWIARQRRVA